MSAKPTIYTKELNERKQKIKTEFEQALRDVHQADGRVYRVPEEARNRSYVYMQMSAENSHYRGAHRSFSVCTKCRAPDPKFRCSACKIIRYCSTSCQTSDWAAHKRICKPK
jgi:hypothetical protein